MRRSGGHRLRAVLGWASILIPGYWVLCLATTLPRFGPSKVSTPFGYATLSFGAALGAIVVVAGVMHQLREKQDSPSGAHQPDSLVEVWHVQAKDLDYFLARCECDWVGPAHDNDSPDAEAAAWADACGHGTNVGPAVVGIAT